MTDPYTEATRHERRGLPTFAKVILVGGGLFAAALVTVVVVGTVYARRSAEELTRKLEAAFETMGSEAAGPAASADVETLADLAESVEGGGVIGRTDRGAITLRAARSRGDLDIDLADLGDWVSEVETLIKEAVEDGFRIRGEADESGGWLTFSRSDGRTVLELYGDGQGAVLKFRSPRTDTRIGLGDEAAEIPEWVPVFPDARVSKHLFSGDSRKGSFGGGVALEADADARNVYDWYADNLAGAGLEPSESRTHWNSRRKRGKIHARSHGLARDREMVVLVRENEKAGAGSLILLMHKVER